MAADSVRAMSETRPSIAVVGGGFAGVGAVVMLRRAGYDDVTVFERGERVGGVWHHNTYPGAACDIPSHLYEFSFAPNPRWSRRYAPQAEIQAYLEDVARRYGVAERIRTGTEVTRASWDTARGRWVVETSAGTHGADVLLTGCGQSAADRSTARSPIRSCAARSRRPTRSAASASCSPTTGIRRSRSRTWSLSPTGSKP